MHVESIQKEVRQLSNLLVGYLLVNFLMFLCIVKSKMKVARISYLLALVLFLFILLASDKNSFVSHWIVNKFSEEIYLNVYESINFPIIGTLSAISIIELLVLLILFIVCVIFSMKAIEIAKISFREEKEVRLKKPVKNLFVRIDNAFRYNTKNYLTKCVMLC